MWETIKKWLGITPNVVEEKVTTIPKLPIGENTPPPRPLKRTFEEEGLPDLPDEFTINDRSLEKREHALPNDLEEPAPVVEEVPGESDSGDTLQELYDREIPDWSELDPQYNGADDDEGLTPSHVAARNEANYVTTPPQPDAVNEDEYRLDDSFWDLGVAEGEEVEEDKLDYESASKNRAEREQNVASLEDSHDFLDDYSVDTGESSVFGDVGDSAFDTSDSEELPADLYDGDYFDSQGRKNTNQGAWTSES